ncbi:B3 domain-containing protein Os01g0234100-like isoform X2 [Macadamia integrifolia]|uniref:B3 domain-containing protein Os01g0234100-like isoform X2 n=1 Tax=Macadamia integrifolia TaxID=60698 RepID=UPI001C4EAB2F|nr:B3 domain-containing protein Os01g0234100-like isoform X2 [Macadamia integrifolia]
MRQQLPKGSGKEEKKNIKKTSVGLAAMEDQNKVTLAKFHKNQQETPPPRITRRKRKRNPKMLPVRKRGSTPPPPPSSPDHMQRNLKRKRNEKEERNPKVFRVRKRASAPPPPRSSSYHKQVLPYKAAKNQSFVSVSDAANSHSMKQAMEVQMNLAPEMPSFVKFMRQTHVTKCFWLSLPVDFGKNLPREDCSITLVDESGEAYETKYLARKVALSAGWRGFSIAHNLVEGDSVVFELIEATKFKVYILRENGLAKFSEVAGDLPLAKENLAGRKNCNADKRDKRHSTSRSLSNRQEKNQNVTPPGSTSNPGPPTGEQFEIDSEVVGSEDLEGTRLVTATMEFKDVKSFEDFTIIGNGLIIDSELSEHVRAKYYELCCSQKAFLHDLLPQGFNWKLISGIIIETVNVADYIRSCNLSTSENDFANWDKCLDAFERLGMNVGFLRAHLQQLVSLAFESEWAMESKMYSEAVFKRDCLVEEIRNLKLKLMESKKACASYDKEVKTLKLKAKEHEVKFQAEVNAPW